MIINGNWSQQYTLSCLAFLWRMRVVYCWCCIYTPHEGTVWQLTRLSNSQNNETAISNRTHIVPLSFLRLHLDYRKCTLEAKFLEQAEIFSHLTYSTTTYGWEHGGMSRGQQFCNSCGEILYPISSAVFLPIPGECQTNSTPGVIQAKLISHSTQG